MKRNKKKVIENKVFTAIETYCHDLQNAGKIDDGNNLAKNISTKVAEGLLPMQQKKIYSNLTNVAMPVAEIAKKCLLSSKLVSAQLNQMHAKTMLVKFKKKRKNKLWYKVYN